MISTNQIQWLFLLSIPVATISWTVIHEEIFREPREFCSRCSKESKSLLKRKLFFIFTCDYCFSHYVTLVAILVTKYKLLMTDFSGYIIAFFSVVWIANLYISLYTLLRSFIKKIQLLNEKEDPK